MGQSNRKDKTVHQITSLPPAAALKLELMFNGMHYSPALEQAAAHSYPNFYPYRFEGSEKHPDGKLKIDIPYLLATDDGTMARIKGNSQSPWSVSGSLAAGYHLDNAATGASYATRFEPRPAWMSRTVDGLPMAQAGIGLHGDMAVINVAPGCEYFLHKSAGKSMRCSFCMYGAPDQRLAHLGQEAGQVEIPGRTFERMQATLAAAIEETEIRHIYLVGGSLPDWQQEGERFLQLASSVQDIVQHKIPVTLGSGALPHKMLERFHHSGLVDAVCFNLEVWSEDLFRQVCPGKDHFVGYQRWIESLEHAVSLWGRERVYTAMVAGIELEPEHGMSWEQAAELAIRGAEDLCSRGIIPIYSLYWPVGGKDHPDYLSRLKNFFERLNLEYAAIRGRHGLSIWDGFMCHRCAYMQLECDIDRAST
jgi:hypothetical protein